jgi:hypothetical protein
VVAAHGQPAYTPRINLIKIEHCRRQRQSIIREEAQEKRKKKKQTKPPDNPTSVADQLLQKTANQKERARR